MNIQYERCGFAKTRLRHPSLPFDSFPYPTRTICRHVRSVNHVKTKRKEVDHILRVWGSVPSALRARGSPAIIHLVCSQFLLKHCVQFLMPRSNGKQLICKIWGLRRCIISNVKVVNTKRHSLSRRQDPFGQRHRGPE